MAVFIYTASGLRQKKAALKAAAISSQASNLTAPTNKTLPAITGVPGISVGAVC